MSASPGARAEEPADGGFVTVELFTSQSCPYCPAADALLAELADRPGILALSLPVPYWNYLGWRDTLSRSEYAERQKAYSSEDKRQWMYTPQFIVQGEISVAGRKPARLTDALKDVAPAPALVVTRADSAVTAHLPAAQLDGAPATVWLVSYEAQPVTVNIGGGRNKGRTLSYSNVVRSIDKMGEWTGAAADLTAPMPAGDVALACAVLVQQGDDGVGPVRAAGKCPDAS